MNDIASRRLGEGGVLGVTNFNEARIVGGRYERIIDDRYEKIVQKKGYERDDKFKNAVYIPQKKLWIIKSQEVPSLINGHEVHVLAVGIPVGQHIDVRRNIEDIADDCNDLGGRNVLDHPGYTHGIIPFLEEDPTLLETLMPKVKGWEVYNSSAAFNLGVLPVVSRIFPPRANQKASDFYFSRIKPNYPHVKPIKSSDGHSKVEIGRAFTETDMPEYEQIQDGQQLLDYLFEGIVETGGECNPSRIRCFMHAVTVIKENGILNSLKRVRKKE